MMLNLLDTMEKIGFGLTLKWFYDQSYEIAVLAKNKM